MRLPRGIAPASSLFAGTGARINRGTHPPASACRNPGTGVYLCVMSESPLVRPAFDDVPPARRRNLAAVAGKDTAPELRVRRLLLRHGIPVPAAPARFAGDAGHRAARPSKDRRGARLLLASPSRSRLPQRGFAEGAGGLVGRETGPQCRARCNAIWPRCGTAGWSVLVLWECEVRDAAGLAARLRSFLG